MGLCGGTSRGALWWNSGGAARWGSVVELRGGALWWGSVVELRGGALWWGSVVELRGGALWWSCAVGLCAYQADEVRAAGWAQGSD